jgi:hypothetical protein
VRNQAEDEDCVAFANANSRAMMRYQHTGEQRVFSAHWFWWHLRQMEGTLGQNTGTYPRDAVKVGRKLGFAPEEAMPEYQGTYQESPPPGSDEAAFPFRTTRYTRLRGLDDILDAIVEKKMILLAINVYTSFENVGPSGIIDAPQAGETLLGGHAIWPYLYDPRGVRIRNQWDTTWGLSGDAILTYNFLNSPAFMEAWQYE